MALFGAQVEYALHTLVNLCLAAPHEPPSARDLADFQRLPLAYVRKLLTQLEKAGIVRATEGLRGGWQLAAGAQALTVLQVADAVQRREPLFVCRDVREQCALWSGQEAPAAARRGVCSIHAVMLAAEQAMRHELAAHTLADLAGRVRGKVSEGGHREIVRWFGERALARSTSSRSKRGPDAPRLGGRQRARAKRARCGPRTPAHRGSRR
ncbi:MAG: Rrf2 family transcriptional regulator [Rubrivivax sp.]|nr:Rrf2 family transcriptional regulator [Rubrivivax sp.]